MKKNIIILSIIFVVIVTGVMLFSYFSSFKKISFLVKQTGITATVFKINKTDQKITSFTNDTVLSLQNGDYYYIAAGDKFDSTHHAFTITDTVKTVTVDPDYSNAYLTSILPAETALIQPILNSTYPTVMAQYTIFNSQLFQKGEWYGAVLRNTIDNQDGFKDTYRVILHKVNNQWTIVHYPEIIETHTKLPTVPINILNAVNALLYS